MKRPGFFSLFFRPKRKWRIILALLPFILVVCLYCIGSFFRHQENPNDKLMPSLVKIATTFSSLAFDKDIRSESILLLTDTIASLSRLGIGLLLSFIGALISGIFIGFYPGIRSLLSPFIIFISIIPPLAILPILFICLGVDEVSKVALIIIGVYPLLTRDCIAFIERLSEEQIIKGLTLGGTPLQIIQRIILPQALPRLLETLRLSLGSAWLFLIASEAIAATSGLGYRIFLKRRYLAMDAIIPYVLWITLLGFILDLILRKANKKLFPWYTTD